MSITKKQAKQIIKALRSNRLASVGALRAEEYCGSITVLDTTDESFVEYLSIAAFRKAFGI